MTDYTIPLDTPVMNFWICLEQIDMSLEGTPPAALPRLCDYLRGYVRGARDGGHLSPDEYLTLRTYITDVEKGLNKD